MTRFDVIASTIADLFEALLICLFIASVLVWAGVGTGVL